MHLSLSGAAHCLLASCCSTYALVALFSAEALGEATSSGGAEVLLARDNGGNILATVWVPSTYGEDSKWALYLDSVDEGAKIGGGTVGHSGTVETKTATLRDTDDHVAYLVVYDVDDSPVELRSAPFDIRESAVGWLLRNHGSVLVGGLIGIISSTFGMLAHEVIKHRTQKREVTRRVYASIAFAAEEMLRRWDSTDAISRCPKS